jgi:hypothetical protein
MLLWQRVCLHVLAAAAAATAATFDVVVADRGTTAKVLSKVPLSLQLLLLKVTNACEGLLIGARRC